MNGSLKSDRHKFAPYSYVHIENFQVIRRFDQKCFLRSRRLSPCDQHNVWYTEMMRPNSTFGFRIFWIFWNFRIVRIALVSRCYKFTCDYFYWWFRYCWSLPAATSLPVLSGLEFWFALTPSLPENSICRLGALSIPRLLDAIGLFTDEELVETEMATFVAVGLDFATTLFSSFCSCILFAILLVQLLKRKFFFRHVWSVVLSMCQCTWFEYWGPS